MRTQSMRTLHQRTFEFIRGYVSSNGEAPTIREIGQFVGLSSGASVHAILKTLERKGLIIRTPYVSRGIELPQVEFLAAGREG